jgi:hypothetical protein
LPLADMPHALTNVCHRGKGGHAVACRDFRFWHYRVNSSNHCSLRRDGRNL